MRDAAELEALNTGLRAQIDQQQAELDRMRAELANLRLRVGQVSVWLVVLATESGQPVCALMTAPSAAQALTEAMRQVPGATGASVFGPAAHSLFMTPGEAAR